MFERIGISLLAFCVFVFGAALGPEKILAAEPLSEMDMEMASLTPASGWTDAMAALPKILSDDDVSRYREIFSLQEDGNWKAADKRIEALENRVLMGHVLAQRYLHPTKYRSLYKELRDWMAEYADHPDAPQIHQVALSRRPATASRRPPPSIPVPA